VTGDYLLGVLGLAAIAVSVAIAGRTLRRALLPGWVGAPALLANAILAIGVLVAVSQLLGLAGILDGIILVAACAIVAGAALRIEPTLAKPTPKGRARTSVAGERLDEGPRDAPAVPNLALAVAIALATLVALQWAAPTLLALDRGIYGGDSLWYHLPFSAHIAQTGSVTELLFTDPLYLNWFYPQNSELLNADFLLLFGDDFLAPFLNLGWLGVAIVAGWCVGRPYGAAATGLAAVATLMSADLMFSRQPGNANNDVVAIALLLAAVAVLVNARRATAVGPLAVAGLAAGLALGTKLTVVPPVGALTIAVILLAGGGRRIRATLAWGGGLLVGGGLWYLRDLLVAGTPFPFVDLGPLDKPEELDGREPFSVADYLTDTDIWGRYFTPGLEERLGDVWPVILLLAVAGVVVWLWRGGALERMLAAVAAVSAVAYLVTPLGASGPEGMPVGFRLNLRYLAPGLAIAFALAAIAPSLTRSASAGRSARWGELARGTALALFAGLALANLVAFEPIELSRLVDSPATTLAIVVAVVALPLAIILAVRRGIPAVRIAAVSAVAIAALVVGGAFAQDRYLDNRYSSAAPDYPEDGHPSIELEQGLGGAYDFARAISGARIGLSGTTGALFQYGLWGRDSDNSVSYIGERGSRGSFHEITECPEWVAAVNTGDFDYLVTTPAYDQDNPEAATAPVEKLWLDGAVGARHVAGNGLVAIWELRGAIDPAACVGKPARGSAPADAPAE